MNTEATSVIPLAQFSPRLHVAIGRSKQVEGVVRVGVRSFGRLLRLRVASEHRQRGHAGFHQGGEGQKCPSGFAFCGVHSEEQRRNEDCGQPPGVRVKTEGRRGGADEAVNHSIVSRRHHSCDKRALCLHVLVSMALPVDSGVTG